MKSIQKKITGIAVITFVAGLILGWFFFRGASQKTSVDTNAIGKVDIKTIWTCTMHPQIRKFEPGFCPICGMELVPLDDTDNSVDPMAIHMSTTAMQLANVSTMIVGTGGNSKMIHLNGKVKIDERQLQTQSSHISGRIESLAVNFTGEFISEGQIIAYLYSPELINAQQELFEARKNKDSQPELFIAAREKLKSWKLTETQIDSILDSGSLNNRFPVLSNTSGYVTKKMVNQGDYIKSGQPMFEIANLSKVWVLFDVYETELSWVKKGSKVKYSVQSLPGENFTGTISYIDPSINPVTRVAIARVEASNSDYKLKPEMFVSGTIESSKLNSKDQITIPKSAVLWTGKRSLVYIKQINSEGVSFKMREVELGASLGDYYNIESGLRAGEEIAISGTFSIDAAAQLAGKPSMMNNIQNANSDGEINRTNDQNTKSDLILKSSSALNNKAKESLNVLFNAYFNFENALSKDDFDAGRETGKRLNILVNEMQMDLFKGSSSSFWEKSINNLKRNTQHLKHAAAIEDLRGAFISITVEFISMAEEVNPTGDPIFIQHCPMANSNEGADWLSKSESISNPYFGKKMTSCGKTIKILK